MSQSVVELQSAGEWLLEWVQVSALVLMAVGSVAEPPSALAEEWVRLWLVEQAAYLRALPKRDDASLLRLARLAKERCPRKGPAIK